MPTTATSEDPNTKAPGNKRPSADWAKENTRLRFDVDIVRKFGLKACRFVTYLECWLAGKVDRNPGSLQYTFDPAWLISKRTGLAPATLERIVNTLLDAKFIRVRHGRKNVRRYELVAARDYYQSRSSQRHVFALRADADVHREPVAILLSNLRYWQEQNKERSRLYEGRFWRYEYVVDLKFKFRGILSARQIQTAIVYMLKKGLVSTLDYVDATGIKDEEIFWITLLEVPPLDELEPTNMVRPASLFTTAGSKIRPEVACQSTASPNDKSPLQSDKQVLQLDKTAKTRNLAEMPANEGLAATANSPLIEAALSVSPELADARSVDTKSHVSASLPSPNISARPTASRKPTASEAECSATELHSPSLISRIDELEGCYHQLARQIQELILTIELNKTSDEAKDGVRSLEILAVRIPYQHRRKFQHEMKGDKADIQKRIDQARAEERIHLNEELLRVGEGKIPRECFGKRFGDPRLYCKSCAWIKSCRVATPTEIQEAIRSVSSLSQPGFDALMAADRVENVAETYRVAYRDVFGRDPQDAAGQAAKVYRYAKILKLPVRLYCLVYMTLWVRGHPKQTFYFKYLSGHKALDSLLMVHGLCKQKFAAVLEDKLATVLDLKFSGDRPIWRHSSTPTEAFLEGWLKICQTDGNPEYKVADEELQRLMMRTLEARHADIDDMLERAQTWVDSAEAPKTLSRFLLEDGEN